MKRKRGFGAIFLLTVFTIFFTACSKEEYKAELGIDGYVYVPERILDTDGIGDLRIAGDYLYYTQNGGNEIARIASAYAFPEDGKPDFSKREVVFAVSSGKTEMPEDVTEALYEAAGSHVEVRDSVNFWFSVKDFAIDKSQKLYYVLQAYVTGDSAMESAGYILCCQDADRRQEYKVFWPEIKGLAVDGEGGVYTLTSEGICIAGPDGRQEGIIPLESSQHGESVYQEDLFGDTEGHVYYMISDHMERKSYEIVKGMGGKLQLQEAGNILGSSYDSCFAMPGGNMLLLRKDSEQILYEYDSKNDTAKKILCWIDSGFQSSQVNSVAGLSSDKILMSYFSALQGGLYQLTRTPVEELPQKELLVLASANPDMGLQDAIIKFNQNSSKYRIIIDGYGAYYSDAEGRWILPELDSALVSSDPPDLVDMRQLNIPKYAEKGILEDLYPYLESSHTLTREEFLDQMLEGLTFDEKLSCISSRFSIKTVTGASRRFEALKSWTMEDMYALERTYPDREIFINNGQGEECSRDFYLGNFCTHYYLEEFVDWDEGKCSFQSREFGRMLEWIKNCVSGSGEAAGDTAKSMEKRQELERNSLLISLDWLGLDLYTLTKQEIGCGEPFRLLGFPTAEGKGHFQADLLDAIGITTGSGNKEGAWEFLEYYLTREPGAGYYVHGFSTNKTLLQESLDDALGEYDRPYTDEDGVDHEENQREVKGIVMVGGELVDFYGISQDQADAVLDVIAATDFTPLSEEEEMIIRIVKEEAESYFSGSKSLEEVTEIIQNRAELVLKERR